MSAKPLKKILEEYLAGTNFKEIDETISVQKLWETIVGKPISNNTKIKSFKYGIITITTTNSVWRNELFFQKKSLLEKLKKSGSELKIKDIILK